MATATEAKPATSTPMLDNRILEGSIDLFIIEDGFNVRDMTTDANREHVAELADSIKEIGQRTPLMTRPGPNGKEIIVGGHTRLLAFKALGWKKPIKYFRVPGDEDVKQRTIGLATDNSGLPLTALEKCAAIDRLIRLEMSQADIAKLGVFGGKGIISNYVKLWGCKNAVEVVRRGYMNANAAIEKMREQQAPPHSLNESKMEAYFKKILDKAEAPAKEPKPTAPVPEYLKREAVEKYLTLLSDFAFTDLNAEDIHSLLSDLGTLKSDVLRYFQEVGFDHNKWADKREADLKAEGEKAEKRAEADAKKAANERAKAEKVANKTKVGNGAVAAPVAS